MTDFLSRILAEKQTEVSLLRRRPAELGPRSSPRRPFSRALHDSPGKPAVIAEVKRASPSRGELCTHFDPPSIAQRYRLGGAAAISVLTDEKHFRGSPAHLAAVRTAVDLPVLRKDFIIDELQVRQTAALNSDAVLLIVAALSASQLDELYKACLELDVEPLIEIHCRQEIDTIMRLSPLPSLIGINNRDLATFKVDLKVTEELAPLLPPAATVVAESGIFSRDDARRLHQAGARAVLIGEALMRCADPATLIQDISNASTN